LEKREGAAREVIAEAKPRFSDRGHKRRRDWCHVLTAEAGPGNHKTGVRAHLLATGKCKVDHLDWTTTTQEKQALFLEKACIGFYDVAIWGPIADGGAANPEAAAEFNEFAQEVMTECVHAGGTFVTGGDGLRLARWEELAQPKRPVREVSFLRESWYIEEEEWIEGEPPAGTERLYTNVEGLEALRGGALEREGPANAGEGEIWRGRVAQEIASAVVKSWRDQQGWVGRDGCGNMVWLARDGAEDSDTDESLGGMGTLRGAKPTRGTTTATPVTAKELRAKEDRKCLGGLRRTVRVLKRLPRMEKVMELIFVVLNLCVRDHPELETQDIKEEIGEVIVEEARKRVAHVIGANLDELGIDPQKEGWQRSPIHGGLLGFIARAAGDPDPVPADWVVGAGDVESNAGCPLGIVNRIPRSGVFPPVEPKEGRAEADRVYLEWQGFENYGSAYEHQEKVEAQLLEETKMPPEGHGGALEFPNLKALLAKVKRWGRAVPAKIAAIPKKASEKLRLIQDLRRNRVNDDVEVPERVVLPRIRDAAADAMGLLDGAKRRNSAGRGPAESAEVEAAVIDIKDAFRLLDVHPSEWRFLAGEFLGRFFLWRALVFGCVSSPLLWCRMVGLIVRLLQALLGGTEARLNVYIDDILLLVMGTAKRRRRLLTVALLFLAVIGVPIAYHKIEYGAQVEWIGALYCVTGSILTVTVPAKKRDEVLDEIEAILELNLVPRTRLRTMAGKLGHLAGIVPYLTAFNRSLYKVAAEEECKGMAFTKQVALDLQWMHYVLGVARGHDLRRVYRLRDARSCFIQITTDASLEGLGSVLAIQGTQVAFIMVEVGKPEEEFLGHPVTSADMPVLEFLIVPRSLRAWAERIRAAAPGRVQVAVRTDSASAMGAAVRMTSGHPLMGRIAREVAADGAVGMYLIDFVEHLPGLANMMADALSHLKVPRELRGLKRQAVPKLSEKFWRTRRPPPLRKRKRKEEEEEKPRVALRGKNVEVMVTNEGAKFSELR
jgi:hypothetical protein